MNRIQVLSLFVLSCWLSDSTLAQDAPRAGSDLDGLGRVTPTDVRDEFRPAREGADEGLRRFRESGHEAHVPLEMPLRSAGDPRPLPEPSAAITLDGIERPHTPLNGGSFSVPGRIGDLTECPHVADDVQVYDFGNLYEVSCPECAPNRVNVHLSIAFPSGATGGCSGALIDSRHVLTAAHCVFNADQGGWATNIVVRPARDGSSAPYGTADMQNALSWTGYTVNDDLRHDIAVIRLDRPVGALTGWMGYGYTSNCNWFTEPYWYLKSYPGQSYGQTTMYLENGDFDGCDGIFEVDRHKSGIPGQSGSVAYKYVGGSMRGYAVSSHNFWNWFFGTDLSSTRLTSSKFAHVVDFIDEVTPATPDLMPLDVGANSIWAPRGSYITGVNYLTHNYSSSPRNGSVSTRVYLSTNDNISQWDTLVQSHSFSWNFSSKGSVRVNAGSVYVPTSLAPGWYYLGVITQDADASSLNNDSDGQDAMRVYVY